MPDTSAPPAIHAELALHVDPSVTAELPHFKAYGVRVRGLAAVDRAQAAYPFADRTYATLMSFDYERLAEDPRIKVWRDAYRRMGLKASEFRSSIEQLVRRSLGDNMLNTPVPIVDLYNRASISFAVPMGGYDMSALPPHPISVRAVADGDYFAPLGGAPENFPLSPGVLAYACGREILCWALNHRDSRLTALRAETDDALFVTEAVDPRGAEASREALAELAGCLATLGAHAGEVVEFAMA